MYRVRVNKYIAIYSYKFSEPERLCSWDVSVVYEFQFSKKKKIIIYIYINKEYNDEMEFVICQSLYKNIDLYDFPVIGVNGYFDDTVVWNFRILIV